MGLRLALESALLRPHRFALVRRPLETDLKCGALFF
jgi:hypothetical protein